MWVIILNKKIYYFIFAGLMYLVAFNLSVFAFPEYTSRQKALKLASALDKGFFRSIKIISVFVKNRGEDDYYLQAILDDGSSRKWLFANVLRCYRLHQ